MYVFVSDLKGNQRMFTATMSQTECIILSTVTLLLLQLCPGEDFLFFASSSGKTWI